MSRTYCANCGAERTAQFCPHCGQNDRDYQRALPPMLGEILRETFEVDSRLLSTLKLLLFQPGELSREFSRNRRASYVTPIRLYLFVSLAFFFLLSLAADIDVTADRSQSAVAEVASGEAADLDVIRKRLDEQHRFKVDAILVRPKDSLSRFLILEMAQAYDPAEGDVSTPDRFLFNLAVDGLYGPRLAYERVLVNLPVAMFVMLPVYAGLLALLYYGRRRFFVEHLVFAVHVQTFAFMVFTLLLLLPNQTSVAALDQIIGGVSAVLLVSTFIYQYLALRHYYGEGRARTLIKFGVLVVTYFSLLVPAFLGVVFTAFSTG